MRVGALLAASAMFVAASFRTYAEKIRLKWMDKSRFMKNIPVQR
jgi:hypothetical protein